MRAFSALKTCRYKFKRKMDDKRSDYYESPVTQVVTVDMERFILGMSGEATRNGYEPHQTEEWY